MGRALRKKTKRDSSLRNPAHKKCARKNRVAPLGMTVCVGRGVAARLKAQPLHRQIQGKMRPSAWARPSVVRVN